MGTVQTRHRTNDLLMKSIARTASREKQQAQGWPHKALYPRLVKKGIAHETGQEGHCTQGWTRSIALKPRSFMDESVAMWPRGSCVRRRGKLQSGDEV